MCRHEIKKKCNTVDLRVQTHGPLFLYIPTQICINSEGVFFLKYIKMIT